MSRTHVLSGRLRRRHGRLLLRVRGELRMLPEQAEMNDQNMTYFIFIGVVVLSVQLHSIRVLIGILIKELQKKVDSDDAKEER